MALERVGKGGKEKQDKGLLTYSITDIRRSVTHQTGDSVLINVFLQIEQSNWVGQTFAYVHIVADGSFQRMFQQQMRLF